MNMSCQLKVVFLKCRVGMGICYKSLSSKPGGIAIAKWYRLHVLSFHYQ